MSNKTVINIKADKEVKKKAQETALELGLPLSIIINAYLKDFIRRRKVTFSLEPELAPATTKLLRQASEDFKKGKNISPALSTGKEIDDYLD